MNMNKTRTKPVSEKNSSDWDSNYFSSNFQLQDSTNTLPIEEINLKELSIYSKSNSWSLRSDAESIHIQEDDEMNKQ